MVRFHNQRSIMDLIFDQSDRLLEWAIEHIGICAFRPDAKAIGLERDGEIVAVVVFDNFSICDCNMHIASDGSRRWMNKSFLLSAFAYPFMQLKLKRVTGLVLESNEAALRFDQHLGFEIEGTHPDADPNGALISLGLLRRNCRFIPTQERT